MSASPTSILHHGGAVGLAMTGLPRRLGLESIGRALFLNSSVWKRQWYMMSQATLTSGRTAPSARWGVWVTMVVDASERMPGGAHAAQLYRCVAGQTWRGRGEFQFGTDWRGRTAGQGPFTVAGEQEQK